MKKWFLIVAMMILTGCAGIGKQSDVFVFTGESENWRVNYISAKSEEDRVENDYWIYYIGDENPGEVSYSIDLGSGATSAGSADLSHTDVIRAGGGCSDCETLKEDDVLQFEVEWDGQQESFEVTYDEEARGVME
ncbi:hypothetical protein [Jeotgalibacillus terrae]|uniref:Lipoprotein n=1 Tax=Jeotgalibacillus terrae TaxID=587735 RepID=A0ABW5ZJW6_9BACL|nr:hypothetical protein [Jeotgalibacillus terrae]MBM7578738.1 hypothetical protein [Jeotgalibacillus terrae]